MSKNPYRGQNFAQARALAEERTTPENAEEEEALFEEAFHSGAFPITAATIPTENGGVSIWDRCKQSDKFARDFVKERGIGRPRGPRGRWKVNEDATAWVDKTQHYSHQDVLSQIAKALSVPEEITA